MTAGDPLACEAYCGGAPLSAASVYQEVRHATGVQAGMA